MVPSFESDVAEASDSSEDDECPPPLPPPRTESLKKNDSEEEATNNVEVVEVADKKVVITDAEPYNSIYSNKNKPLTNGAVNGDMEAGSSSNSSSGSAEASPNKCILTSNKLSRLANILFLTTSYCDKYGVTLSHEKTKLLMITGKEQADMEVYNPISIDGHAIGFSEEAEHVIR